MKKENWLNECELQKSYPQCRKNWVIHEVIHIIHRKVGKKSGLHSKIIECLFCEEIIKLSDFVESLEKLLTFQI